MDMLQQVFGMGEKKPPSLFNKACEKFIYLEVLRKPAPKTAPGGKAEELGSRAPQLRLQEAYGPDRLHAGPETGAARNGEGEQELLCAGAGEV